MLKEVNKDMLIGQILDAESETARFFMEMGMHCLGCPASRGESLEEACMVHNIECSIMVDKINEFLAEKNK